MHRLVSAHFHCAPHRLIDRYWERLLDPELPLNQVFARASFPEDLEEMAGAIEQVVTANAAHILLIYVDIIEFQGEHVRAFYEGMAKRFATAYGPRFAARKKAGEFGDADPITAVMVATRWLFYFYTVEKCFGVPLHLGMTGKQATTEFIRLLRYGLLRDRPQNGGRPSIRKQPIQRKPIRQKTRTAKPAKAK